MPAATGGPIAELGALMRSVEELDLTPIIADTIDFGLPSELSCAPCRVDEPESWSCDPA